VSYSPETERDIQTVGSLNPQQDRELLRLRSLLLGKDYEELLELKNLLQELNSRNRFIAEALPSAVILSAEQDDQLTRALMQSIEEALQISVRRNPGPLVDAIFPVIGPSIRKSITETLAELLQRVNQLVEHSLSFRSLKWRFDAWRTGASYAEIVLQHTLVYQVEQVFLIDKKTGLLITHLISDTAIAKDPDMVSGMLTAIQDFVRDSFQVDELDGLQQMRLGDLSILIEPGPQAVLAVAVRGNPPDDLRTILVEALERIHLKFAEKLQNFDGDGIQLENSQLELELESCLVSQAVDHQKRPISPLTWLILAVFAVLLAWWLYGYAARQAQLGEALDKLNSEPGVIVTGTAHEQDWFVIRGLRDELARHPDDVVGSGVASTLKIEWQFQPYIAISPEFNLQRALTSLQPPEDVQLSIDGSKLVVAGKAKEDWIEYVRATGLLIPGIQSVDTQGVLTSKSSQQQYQESKAFLEASYLLFDYSESELSDSERERIPGITASIRSILSSGSGLQRIVVIGHSDRKGSNIARDKISFERANSVIQVLISEGCPETLFIAEGRGDREAYEDNENINRRVSFSVQERNRPAALDK
jgi:outer membrane protein OmpA-like peptidoglycan-associated protein